jgi:hypothetical protein
MVTKNPCVNRILALEPREGPLSRHTRWGYAGRTGMQIATSSCKALWRPWAVVAVVATSWAACHSPLRARTDGGDAAGPGGVRDASELADRPDIFSVPDRGEDGALVPDADSTVDAASDAIGICGTCARQETQYCGRIGDGCCGTLECGACPDGWQCTSSGICVSSPPGCTPVACENSGGQYCGTIGDGCGRTLDCGSCSEAGWECIDHVCVGPASVCKSYACDSPYVICGKVGDGCGRTLDCTRTCPLGQSCVDSLCDSPEIDCEPWQTCTASTGDHYCGKIGDGCRGTLDCGDDCPVGWSCVNHICVGSLATCIPFTCDRTSLGRICGTVGDGCGGVLECGLCPDGRECVDFICADPSPQKPPPIPPPPPLPAPPPPFLPSPPAAPALPPAPESCLLP